MHLFDVPDRILVCGDRDWVDHYIIKVILGALLDPWREQQTIIHGDGRGADSIADSVARDIGYRVKAFPANWKEYGKSAGPIRNQKMLVVGKPDVVYAFHNDLSASKGTKDMVNRATKAGLPVYIIGSRNIT